jgi:ABC-type lipoprotein release transport system permease subunit
MTPLSLIRSSLTHYWRTNLAVVAGVAAAVTVLSGALLVGDSVRESLRDLVEARLGATDLAIVSQDFFRAALADDLESDAAFARDFRDITPLISAQGVATGQTSRRRVSRVQVYGVDDRFWTFHGVADPAGSAPSDGQPAQSRDVLLSPALARELGAEVGTTVLLRVQRPSDIPLESLHGQRDDVGRTVRLTVKAIVPAAALGEFSLQPQQGDVRAAFVPLARLQADLGVGEHVNTLLVSIKPEAEPAAAAGHLENLIRERATLEDVGLRLRVLETPQVLSLEASGSLIDQARSQAATDAARELKMFALPVFTYLANTIRTKDRQLPYSLITAFDLSIIAPDIHAEETGLPPMVLNDWAAKDLGVKSGDRVAVDYYVWEDQGRLSTRSENFLVVGVVPLSGVAADRDFAPEYPGITESANLSDWNPPFPVDLKRVRPIDEEYWHKYRTTPKAFIPDNVGQSMWRSRFGEATSIRVNPPKGMPLAQARDQFSDRLRAALDPVALGLAVRDVRASGVGASRGATDFGEYFTYFSFFLVVSALVLAALFFKLGIEQRAREVGLLRAVGFTTAAVRRLFVAEAAVLTLAGCVLGLAGAVLYGYMMMTGLRTWWVDAVGTTALTLHVSALPLVAGALGGALAAVGCIWWTLRSLSKISERSLLAGQIEPERSTEHAARRLTPGALSLTFSALGVLLVASGALKWLGAAGAFFGAGAAFLAAFLSLAAFMLGRRPRAILAGHGWWSMSRLGLRNATYRPGRSVLSMAVVASATFILISVDAFRRDPGAASTDPHSGTGGYALMVDTVLPIVRDPNSPDGRELLGTTSFKDVSVMPFRVLPGDDTSCLNLYEPRQPRILGVSKTFIDEGRFAFSGSLDRDDREKANPWLLLTQEQRDDSIPVIADANSMTYVLHKGLGDEIVFDHRGRVVTMRLVAALSDSVLQGELMMSEANFLKAFPEQEGYQFMMVAAPSSSIPDVETTIEDQLSDFGADATTTAERLAEFHRVENTYLSTFQTLGGLGLLLGTVGLSAVLLRNVLERRRELALLGAVGFGRTSLFTIVVAESALLLVCGLGAGVICALIAIAPAAAERGGRLPTGAGAWLLLFAVFGTGLVASVVAAKAAIHSKLLDALRAE